MGGGGKAKGKSFKGWGNAANQGSWGKGSWNNGANNSWHKGTQKGKGMQNGKENGMQNGFQKGMQKGVQKGMGKSAPVDKPDIAYAPAVDDVVKSTELKVEDFIPKARQYLEALKAAGKLKDACAYLKESLKDVTRDHVKNWHAYVFTLLRKYDADFYDKYKVTAWKPQQRYYQNSDSPTGERRGGKNKEKNGNDFKFDVNATDFVPGKVWMPPAALTLSGTALNLFNEEEALHFKCEKSSSPSHAAAVAAKAEVRLMQAMRVAHKEDENEEAGLARQISVDSEGIVHGDASPSNKSGSPDRLKLFHRKRQSRTNSDDQSTVASIDDAGTIHGQTAIDRSPLIVPTCLAAQ